MAALSVQSEIGTSLSRRPSSAQGDRRPVAGTRGALELDDELIDDRPLEGGGQIGSPALRLLRPQVTDSVDEGGLQPAEAEVEAALAHRNRELECVGVAALR